MKVGDKVYVVLEVEKIDESDNMFYANAGESGGLWFDKSEAITQLPIQEGRWMLVSNDNKKFETGCVIGKADSSFITFNACKGFAKFKYAKEKPIKRKLTMQEIAEKFNLDVENIEICTE